MRVFQRTLLLVVVCSGVCAAPVQAQGLGSVFGKVTDSVGHALAGVVVTINGTGLQQPARTTTTSSGAYELAKVPAGVYTVTFELANFARTVRPNVSIATGFNAEVDVRLAAGAPTAEAIASTTPIVIDTKSASTGATYSTPLFQDVPTPRDPFQVINMAPGVALSALNVGGALSGQQVTPSIFGTSANVQWNLEGGNITDLSANAAPNYFNFDAFQDVQVITGAGDVSVQSSGLFINLVTKSGSNVFKGTATAKFENSALQSNNVSPALFASAGSTAFSGSPLHRIGEYSVEYGGPAIRDRLWFWGAADRQDINVGIPNFYDTSRSECTAGFTQYAQLSQAQACLVNDQTLITNTNGKLNYQISGANRLQYLFSSDDKVRNHRSASAATTPEATYRQYSPGTLPDLTQQLTHTLTLGDRLVFTNQVTHAANGFYLDYQDSSRCGDSMYGRTAPSDPACQWNVQPLVNVATGLESRGPASSYQTKRTTSEVKTDGNYFVSGLGGDHAIKFGAGWRKAPVLTYTHTGGGAIARVEGTAPYEAMLYRDGLFNYDWWTWWSYVQDSYSRGRLRVNGGVRQDYQNSLFLGGCVPANVVAPQLLPSQCQGPADPKQPFSNYAPRVSGTYDLFGDGRTSIHASYAYYHDTKIDLASSLSNLGTIVLTWGPNQTSGACSATPGASCWTDANGDDIVQLNELHGTPLTNTTQFNTTTGILTNPLPLVDRDVPIGRTREATAGVDHELMRNVVVGVDYIYRKYDLGSASYTQGYEPDCATSTTAPCAKVGFPVSQLYNTSVQTYTDPVTGIAAPYYVVCTNCVLPNGVATIAAEALSYTTYKGLTVSARKRLSDRWQLNSSFTWNDARQFFPNGSYTNPTGLQFVQGMPTTGTSNLPYLFKAQGSAMLVWGLNVAANLNVQGGAVRVLTINGPGTVYGGLTNAGGAHTISYGTLAFQNQGTTRYPSTSELDLSVQRTIALGGGGQRVTLMLDCFNVLNISTITAYGSNNLDSTAFNAVTGIIPPRVFRIGARIAF